MRDMWRARRIRRIPRRSVNPYTHGIAMAKAITNRRCIARWARPARQLTPSPKKVAYVSASSALNFSGSRMMREPGNMVVEQSEEAAGWALVA